MAHYFYSIPTQNFLNLDLVDKALKDKPECERDYLPKALKNPINGLFDIIKSNAAVCLDPSTGKITVDQIRMYAYQDYYSRKEITAREGLVQKFVTDVEEPVRSFAEDKIKGLDWADNEAFKDAMEDILTEYEANAVLNPDNFPPYGMVFRHTYTMQITRQGLLKAINNEDVMDYFHDAEYHSTHMKNVIERTKKLQKHGDHCPEGISGVLKTRNEPFYKLYNKAFEDDRAEKDETKENRPYIAEARGQMFAQGEAICR